MYILRSNDKINPLLKYSKKYILELSRRQKNIFFCKYILHSAQNKDKEAIIDGLDKLFVPYPDMLNIWRSVVRTYRKEEGEKIDLLFKHAFGNAKKKKNDAPNTFSGF